MAPRILSLFQTESGEEALNVGGVTFDLFVRTLNFFHPRTALATKLAQLFKAYDIDGDGVISERDLQQMLKYYTGPHLTEATCRVLVRKTMQHALARCGGGHESSSGGTDRVSRPPRNQSSSLDSPPASAAASLPHRGLSFADFSRVVTREGMDPLNVDIPIQS